MPKTENKKRQAVFDLAENCIHWQGRFEMIILTFYKELVHTNFDNAFFINAWQRLDQKKSLRFRLLNNSSFLDKVKCVSFLGENINACRFKVNDQINSFIYETNTCFSYDFFLGTRQHQNFTTTNSTAQQSAKL